MLLSVSTPLLVSFLNAEFSFSESESNIVLWPGHEFR